MKISQRAQKIAPSITLATSAKAKALKESGLDVLSLTVGEPDFTTPKNIGAASKKAIDNGTASFYKPSAGIMELRQAIIERTEKDYGLTYHQNQVMVTEGAKFATFCLFQVLLDAGDEVLIPTPYWVSYSEQVKLAQGKSVFVAGKETNSYKVTVEELEAARTTKTQALLLNSPCNPTGAVYTAEELQKIGEWAVAHDIVILSDDIYGKLVYNKNKFTPIATLSEKIRKQTIIINGVSKTYSMTGWRIGYVLGDEQIIQAMIAFASQSTSNCAAVSQYAAVEALTGTQETVEEMRQAFENRLNTIYPKFAALPGFKLTKPQGAFYLFPNIRETLTLCGYEHVTDWVQDLLEEVQVAVVTGEGFGAPDNIRISYATDLETLEKAVARMKIFIESKIALKV